jgi:hypothetical protein
MLLIYARTSSSVPLKILSIDDGTVLKSFSHLLHRNKKVDFIEQFNEKLLVKQEGENLQILDVSIIPNSTKQRIFASLLRVLTLNSLVHLISR